MLLNRIELHNFKKLRRADIAFQNGLTGIIGGNGSGKSTIVEAIAWALYGSRASTIKKEFIKNSQARESESVEVRLELDLGKHRIGLYRGMRGKSMAPEAHLFLDGAEVASGTREVDLQLERIIKISFPDFMKTFYARQKDLDNLLREGGMGKREYLLKLLGLDEIREAVLERIKGDERGMENERNRTMGAVAEIGDVEGRMTNVSGEIREASEKTSSARIREIDISKAVESFRDAVEGWGWKERDHGIVQADLARLDKSAAEKKASAEKERERLNRMEGQKGELAKLEPDLRRLDDVRQRLEVLEPLRQKHEDLDKQRIKAITRREGLERSVTDDERRLLSLKKDRAELLKLEPEEAEYRKAETTLSSLDAIRDEHNRLKAVLGREEGTLHATSESLSRLDGEISKLMRSAERLKELDPIIKRHCFLVEENKRLEGLREKSRDKEHLLSRLPPIASRISAHSSAIERCRGELGSLSDLEVEGARIRCDGSALDEEASKLQELSAIERARLRELRELKSRSKKALQRIEEMGPESICPTCERPLEDQYSILQSKYEEEIARASAEEGEVEKRISEFAARVEEIASARKKVEAAIESLRKRSMRKAELLAEEASHRLGAEGVEREKDEIEASILAIGDVDYSEDDHRRLRQEIEDMRPLVEEHSSIRSRLEERPRREAERVKLFEEAEGLKQKISKIRGSITSLGFREEEYAETKGRLADLKAAHRRWQSLSQTVEEIPAVEGRIASLREEMSELDLRLEEIKAGLVDLGFDSQEHSNLKDEEKRLASSEKRAQQLNISLAGEAECRERLDRAAKDLAVLKLEINAGEKRMEEIAYSLEAHSAAKALFADAQIRLDSARQEIATISGRLDALRADLKRLSEERDRLAQHRERISVLDRRLEIVDVARRLVNRFMDSILVRVKDDIAQAAGDILEELSGKYSLVKIDEDFNILVEDAGEYYPIYRFSGGEIDMMALAVRLSISEYLMRFRKDGPSYSFIILDEIFGSQDIEHRESMIGMLRRLEERFPQIIAISHISDVQGQFDNTITVIDEGIGSSRVEVG
ncbi:MAG: SMC family ATPase [Methanotrichaceae archaeon]|nr:SMC family ATPase [Methanotrichaceae archaeon]